LLLTEPRTSIDCEVDIYRVGIDKICTVGLDRTKVGETKIDGAELDELSLEELGEIKSRLMKMGLMKLVKCMGIRAALAQYL